jgi:acid phosphatase class B
VPTTNTGCVQREFVNFTIYIVDGFAFSSSGFHHSDNLLSEKWETFVKNQIFQCNKQNVLANESPETVNYKKINICE